MITVLASCLTNKEIEFLNKKPELSKKIQHPIAGECYEFSDKVYEGFEKHIITSSGERAFALRVMSKVLRINPQKAKDPESCKASLVACACGLYPVSPMEAERIIRSLKF